MNLPWNKRFYRLSKDGEAIGYMAAAGEYFVATSAAADLHSLASVNHGMAIAFRIGVFFAILGLITDSWKSIKRLVPTERLAF